MTKFFKAARNSIGSFVKDEEGAQIVEYALIIAVISLVLIVALRNLNGGDFTTFIAEVGACLTNGATCGP
ncbi:Flp family type IVb pilin [Variovorax sp. MHTC-1]|uniref:Flp family type IVb pilin n=1 Tax=Variovorax sp. MHTC-1 TaxID=2495593 RepID=UPI000F8736FF|nr:Flp family type IVb pilin [Variovorax sp. MHTC-1]RST52293.1 Flp family type IVb pilin [Variovorax sp. MHTC-1]